MKIKLACGLFHKGQLYQFVTVDALRIKQQRYLQDAEDIVNNLGHIPKLLKDMVIEISSEDGKVFEGDKVEAIAKLPSGDVDKLIVKIRENTYGSIYYFPAECSNHWINPKTKQKELCGKEQDIKVELAKLETTYMKNPEQRTYSVEIKNNRIAEIGLIYFDGVVDLYNTFRKRNEGPLETSVEEATVKQILRKIDGKKPTEDDILDLYDTDFSILNEEYEKYVGGIDTLITHKCKQCKKDFTVPLPTVDPRFFARS